MSMFVRRREAAGMLGVCTRTLARWHEAGVLRARRVGPRLMVYDPEELRRFAKGDVVARTTTDVVAGTLNGPMPETMTDAMTYPVTRTTRDTMPDLAAGAMSDAVIGAAKGSMPDTTPEAGERAVDVVRGEGR